MMHTQKNGEWLTSVSDQNLFEAILTFIEEQIDDESEQTVTNTVGSLPIARRALATMALVWGEVENGGLPQFFYNKTDVRWHAWAMEAARLLDMPGTGKALETGSEIVRELLPALERGQLDWSEYCNLVGETFETRCGSTFWDDELKEFEQRGAAYIRSNPDLARLVLEALEKHAEEEVGRRDKELAVTNRERELLFTAGALAAYLDDFTPDDTREACTVKQSADGTFNVDYQYTDAAYGLSISCEVDIHPSEKEAKDWCEARSRLLWSAMGWNLNPERGVEEQNEFFWWGDQSYYSVVLLEGEPFGFGFYARSGTKRFSLTINGLIFQDTDAMAEAVGPALDNVLSYEP